MEKTTRPLPAALSPDQWERLSAGKLPVAMRLPWTVLVPVQLTQEMAIANALLRPGSPYKITQRHVELVRSAAESAIPGFAQSELDELRALAAALAALLPPEESAPA